MLACQIVGMKKPENFFFPNGRHLSLIPVFADIKHSRELAIIDVACICAQITQYCNGILHTCIVARHVLISVQHLRIRLLFREILC